jgi:hypothetical protein
MRNLYALLILSLLSTGLSAQYPFVQVTDINDASPADLAACNDTSSYYQDTVTVVCYVVTDGNLCEVASSSINGANGVRPFIFVNDTANSGAVGPRTGLQVMGVNWGTSQATAGFTSLIAGDLVEITGVVGMFNNSTQFQPLDNNSLTILSSTFPTINATKVSVGDLNDQNQVNQLVTGEQWAGCFIQLDSVSVTNVNQFGAGATARFEFTVTDKNGNQLEVADFFAAQRLSTWSTINPNTPYTTGQLTNLPTNGTFYTSLRGVVEHNGNGCTGGNGAGYRIHPFDTSHYQVGLAVPAITNVMINPAVPGSNDPITVSADVVDSDGSVDSVHIFWTGDTSLPVSAYTKAPMTISSGFTYSYTIPALGSEGIVSYFIQAVDNDGGISTHPATPVGQTQEVALIFVRDNGLSIVDVQTPLGSDDSSPFEGQRVTVRGYVSAAARDCDLGYVYIQDGVATEYAGLALRGSLNLANLYRNEYVEATGIIEEQFGFTQMLIDSVKSLGSGQLIVPVDLDPGTITNDAEQEKYESMLVRYVNIGGGSLYITDPDLGFGEYAISSQQNPGSSDEERRVLAGRQDGTRAQSSLHVQLVSDTVYGNQNGTMVFPPIATTSSMTMDAMTGILWYAFGNFKITPRNNFDIENLSVTLDTSNCNTPTFSIVEVGAESNFEIYPNPAQDIINIEGNGEELVVQLFDLKGSLIMEQDHNEAGAMRLSVRNLEPGIYLVKVTEGNWSTSTYRVIVTK